MTNLMFAYDEVGSGYQDGSMEVNTVAATRDFTTFYTVRAYSIESQYGMCPDAGSRLSGILLGDDDTAWDFDDYTLSTFPWATFNRTAHTLVAAYNAGSDYFYCNHTRTFTNVSGGDEDVNEMGIFWRGSGTTNEYFLLVRDVLGSPLTVANAETVDVTYEFRSPTYP